MLRLGRALFSSLKGNSIRNASSLQFANYGAPKDVLKYAISLFLSVLLLLLLLLRPHHHYHLLLLYLSPYFALKVEQGYCSECAFFFGSDSESERCAHSRPRHPIGTEISSLFSPCCQITLILLLLCLFCILYSVY